VSTRGLYCDLLCSPYMTFGVDCSEKFLFRKSNKQHIKTVGTRSSPPHALPRSSGHGFAHTPARLRKPQAAPT
jgi:hypothetical protein